MAAAPPGLSCTIWFTQRTGSTWLCQALGSTGIAGRPAELLHRAAPGALLGHFGAATVAELRAKLWQLGSTPNGVFGLKHGLSEPRFGELVRLFRGLPGAQGDRAGRLDVWETFFPNHRHVFMTRRNKVRLAVSWWRAIRSGEWHRSRGAPSTGAPVEDAYDFQAIDTLLNASVLREAGIQELLAEGGVLPLTVAYEDLVRDPEGTIRLVLRFLGLPDGAGASLPAPGYERLADDLSEAWVQRFRREKQAGWRDAGW